MNSPASTVVSNGENETYAQEEEYMEVQEDKSREIEAVKEEYHSFSPFSPTSYDSDYKD